MENFLLDFPGVLIVVSHDRYFMDKIVDHLFVFQGDGDIQDFPGNYSDYRAYESSQPTIAKTKEAKTEKPKASTQEKLAFNEQKEFRNLESKIRALELDKKALEAQFNDPNLNQETIQELSSKLEALNEELETKELRWFELAEKYEAP